VQNGSYMSQPLSLQLNTVVGAPMNGWNPLAQNMGTAQEPAHEWQEVTAASTRKMRKMTEADQAVRALLGLSTLPGATCAGKEEAGGGRDEETRGVEGGGGGHGGGSASAVLAPGGT
jgi:hypothetical protein